MLVEEDHGPQEEGRLGLVGGREGSIFRPASKGSSRCLQILLQDRLCQAYMLRWELTLVRRIP